MNIILCYENICFFFKLKSHNDKDVKTLKYYVY